MMNRFQMSDIDKTANIHFIGIGGISMSGLAQIVLKDGYGVSGSDWNKSAITEKLENMGADIVYGHGAVNEDGINKASLVVYTAAAKADNPAIVLAKEKGKYLFTAGANPYLTIKPARGEGEKPLELIKKCFEALKD